MRRQAESVLVLCSYTTGLLTAGAAWWVRLPLPSQSEEVLERKVAEFGNCSLYCWWMYLFFFLYILNKIKSLVLPSCPCENPLLFILVSSRACVSAVKEVRGGKCQLDSYLDQGYRWPFPLPHRSVPPQVGRLMCGFSVLSRSGILRAVWGSADSTHSTNALI